MLHLLALVAAAVVPVALLVCTAAVLSAGGHGRCGLGQEASFRLALGLYAAAAALGLRLAVAAARLGRASRGALVRGAAASAAVPYPIDGRRAALVLPGDHPVAYTAGLARPQVVVSRGLLSLLDPAERRALLVHELAHAQGRHPRLLFLGGVVVEALPFLPFLRRIFASMRLQLEMAADERACAAVGDRRILARAIAKAALAASPSGAALPAGGAGLRRRLARLAEPQGASRLAAALTAVAVGVTASAVALAICLALHTAVPAATAALCGAVVAALVLPPLAAGRGRL